jgi:hypothetical protein
MLQLSSVHSLPSSQSACAMQQFAIAPHVWSAVHTVQTLCPGQSFTVTQHPGMGVWAQPWTVSQLSSVHGFPSSQSSGTPGVQTPL